MVVIELLQRATWSLTKGYVKNHLRGTARIRKLTLKDKGKVYGVGT